MSARRLRALLVREVRATLRDRFTCGGARHGTTASLRADEIDDLVTFLGTL